MKTIVMQDMRDVAARCRARTCALRQPTSCRCAAPKTSKSSSIRWIAIAIAKISRSEASVKGSVSKRFDGIDSDGDGYLSKREFAARPSDERFE